MARSSPELDDEGMPEASTFAPAYHWACAIDDEDGGYALSVRAHDLAEVVPHHRAIGQWVARLENRNSRDVAVFHTSLVVRANGQRLEKRTRGVTLPELVVQGWSADRILGRFTEGFSAEVRDDSPHDHIAGTRFFRIASDPMADQKHYRLLNRDGSFNVSRRGMKRAPVRDMYHNLLRVSLWQFMLLLMGVYFAVNCFFALAYTLCGPDALEGATPGSFAHHFADAFFFSVQTFATIGYGKLTPSGIAANLLVTFEALIGLLGVALATGLLFARFSRPTARVIFSEVAVVSPHDGVPSLVFRMANARLNQIVEARVNVSLAKDEVTAEGERYRNFHDLSLERGTSPIFALSWTVVHPITDKSPMHKLTHDDLVESRAELFVSLTGIDDTFSQTIHTRFSYTPDEILWDHYFEDILSRSDDKKIVMNLEKMHEVRDRP